jgi:hypothetical protein
MAAFDLVILLARHAGFAAALQRQAVFMHVDPHLFTRQAGKFSSENEGPVRFAQIDRRRPALRPMRGQSFQAVLDADQIAEGIPTRKDHDSRIVACPAGGPELGPYVKLERFY